MLQRILLALLLVTLTTSYLGAQNLHRDQKRGFQINAPAKWTQIPISTAEKWVVAKYLSDKDYRDKAEGRTHRPEMKVVLFPDAVTKERGAKITKTDRGFSFRLKNPYRDFDAYMKAKARGGFFLSDTKERKVNGIKVVCQRYKFEKLTSQRIGIVWIFEGRDAKWAVYFEGLKDHIKKLEPMFTKSLKSFKFIQRKGSILESQSSGDNNVVVDTTLGGKKETPSEKRKKREERFDRQVRRTSATLTSGWAVQKTKNFVAFTHVDKKYTMRVLKQCEAVRKWMDKNFKFLKNGTPGRTVIRICANSAEERSFRETLGRSNDAYEITTHKPVGENSFESEFVNKAVVNKWFSDKDPKLSWSLPGWFQIGLTQVLGSSDLKGSTLKLKPSIWEKTAMRELANDDKLAKPRKFLTASNQEFYKVEHARSQAGAFMRFLLTGPKKKVKGFIENYVNAVLVVAAEEEAREKKEREAERIKSTADLSEEEQEKLEDERFRKRKGKKDDRLQKIFDRAFGSWNSSKWKKFESSYMSFAG